MTLERPLAAHDEWADLPPSYLYTGAQAPALLAVRDALAQAMVTQSRGGAGRRALIEAEEQARVVVGRALGRPPSEVAFLGDASTAWNLVANGLDWQPGDNVVLNELEHASVYLPFLRLAPRGLDVRFVAAGARGLVEPADLLAAVDEHTRAVAISHVAYVNGARHDIGALASSLSELAVPLFVDWSHSLGVLPIDTAGVAIGISASYKWTLGPYGVGILHWNPTLLPDFEPGGVGWRSVADLFDPQRLSRVVLDASASRFRQGAASFAGIAGLAAGLSRLAAWPTESVAEHALGLSAEARRRLHELGHRVLTPSAPEAQSGNVSIALPAGEVVAERLAERGVEVWGGDGRIRASFHVMNSLADVDALIEGLTAVSPASARV